MANYKAPVQDMLFTITELAGLAEISALPGCNEISLDLINAILEEANKFASEVLAPLNSVGDKQGCTLADGNVSTANGFKEAYQQFISNGWNGLTAPQEHGGQALPYVIAMPVQEMWNAANMAFSLCPMLTSATIEALCAHGSEQQKQKYLSKLVSGEWSGTMNLTEPQAGSDLSAIRTKAVPQEDHFLIRGTKIFITWGEHDMAENIVHMVLARTPNAPEGVKGISLFLVPKYLIDEDGGIGKRNDLRCISLEHKLGIHASPTAVMAFGERDGAIGYLVGQENRGLEYMFTMMNHARLGVGIEGLGIAERAYQHALNYAKERVQGRDVGSKTDERVTIIHHPDVRRMLMTMKVQIEAMRALTYVVAARMDVAQRHTDANIRARAQRFVDLLIPIVKAWCTEQSFEITSVGMQVFGGTGYIEETGAAQLLRDARITSIYEGTTGIQANDFVGRKLCANSGVAVRELMEEIQDQLNDMQAMADPIFAEIIQAFEEALGHLNSVTQYILDHIMKEPKIAYAGSVLSVKLFGCVLGGWHLVRSAAHAQQRLANDSEIKALVKRKVASAQFYAYHILPAAAGLAHAILYGADATFTLDESEF